jgi:ABC-2 type transport system ATP-binding protein
MRQELGLAQALIGNPSVLILDEPATGLDPQGIAWIRSFLRNFADRGGTVLLSSHLLAEVQATADHLIVIRAGKIVAAGAMADLLAASGLIVRAADQAALIRLLTADSIPFTPGPAGALRAGAGASPDRIAELAMAAGLPLTELRAVGDTGLEELFLSLTGPGAGAPNPKEAR